MAGEFAEVVGAEEVDRGLAAMTTKSDSFKRAMAQASNGVRIMMRRKVATQFKKGKGYLERSVGYKIVQTIDSVEGWIKPRAFYAGTLEFGKVIKPRYAQYMTFPLLGGNSGAVLYRRFRKEAKASYWAAKKEADHYGVEFSDRLTDHVMRFRVGKGAKAPDMADLSWHRVKSITVGAHPFVAPTARESESEVADILGSGYVAAFAVAR